MGIWQPEAGVVHSQAMHSHVSSFAHAQGDRLSWCGPPVPMHIARAECSSAASATSCSPCSRGAIENDYAYVQRLCRARQYRASVAHVE